MSIQATGDRVIVGGRDGSDTEQTESGLFIAKTDDKGYCTGEVLSVGPEQEQIKVGDTIVYKDLVNYHFTAHRAWANCP